MFHGFFQEFLVNRRRLFYAARFAQLFDAQSRAVERLLGHLRDLPSESLDGVDLPSHFLGRAIIGRAIAARAGGFELPLAILSS